MDMLITLLFCGILGLVSSLSDDEDDNSTAGFDDASYLPVVAAVAVHTYISLSALIELIAAPAPVPQRLSADVQPLHYNLHLATEPDRSIFWGHVHIVVHVSAETRNITIHANDLLLDRKSLSVSEQMTGAAIVVETIEYEPQNEWYVILLATSLHQDKNYILNIAFKGQLLQQTYGLLCSEYTNGNKTRWIVTTVFEPTGARSVFPCFDEPAFKARFNVNIATPPDMHVLSNMPLWDTSEPVEELPGWIWSRFEESVPMSTYTVTFVVSDFVEVRSDGPSKFSVWVPAGSEERVSLMVKLGPAIVAALEQFTGVKYQLPKLDNVILPESISQQTIVGMEYWGLIVYSESSILYDEQLSSYSRKKESLDLLTHEIAHMWFGNLVTPVWWNQLWLKEGFADYCTFIILAEVLHDWQMEVDFVVNKMQIALNYDMGRKSVHEAAVRRDDIEKKYDIHSYNIGATFVRMMKSFMSDITFRTGVQLYLKKYSYRAATAQDLFDMLDIAVSTSSMSSSLPPGVSMADIMDPWVSLSGYPLITVTRNYSTGEAAVCQEQYYIKDTALWWVPLSYTTEAESDFNNTLPKLWLSPNDSCITVTGLPDEKQWVIFNIQQTGYYRVKYDLHNLELLADFLNSDKYSKIHVLNRAHLLDDITSLVKFNELDVEVLQQVARYLVREDNPAPWLVLIQYVEEFCNFLGEESKLLESLVHSMEGLIHDVQEKSVPHLWEMINEIACSLTCSPSICTHSSYNQFSSFKDQPIKNRIKPSQRRMVLCNALQDEQATEEDVLFLWQLGRSSDFIEERNEISEVLAECPSTPSLQFRYLLLISQGDNWMYPHKISRVIADACLKTNSVHAIGQVLAAMGDSNPNSHAAAVLYALEAVTINIASYSGSNGESGKIWCRVVMGWLTGMHDVTLSNSSS